MNQRTFERRLQHKFDLSREETRVLGDQLTDTEEIHVSQAMGLIKRLDQPQPIEVRKTDGPRFSSVA